VKQDATFFQEREPVLVYIAKRLRDALRLETILTDAGLDYGVEADHYQGGIIFRTQRVGAFFYVLPKAVDATHQVMQANGYRPFIEG
jgi:hypothetical protein